MKDFEKGQTSDVLSYSVERYIMHSKKFPENQGKRQNFNPSILPYKFGLIFMRIKQKKKIQTGRFSKMAIFQNRQFSKIFRENFTGSSLG